MKTLLDFNCSLIRREKLFSTKRNNIDLQVKELETKLDKMKYPDIMVVFKPIFKDIKQKLKADGFVMYGPFGLDNEKTIYWLKDIKKCITEKDNVLGSLCLISDPYGVSIRDVSITKNTFPNSSIGAMNGGNHPSIVIDDKMDIEWLLKFVQKQ